MVVLSNDELAVQVAEYGAELSSIDFILHAKKLGAVSIGDILADVDEETPAYAGHTLQYFQSNSEGALIDRLYQADDEGTDGIVFNAGAYTHTSVALHDAIRAIGVPVIEVHISNVHTREPFRHHSFISPACRGVICGFGMDSYRLAVEALIEAERA